MFLHRLTLHHIRAFSEASLAFTARENGSGGWHVLLGENGVGKTTILQAIALALAGEKAANFLLPNTQGWLPVGAAFGWCGAAVEHNSRLAEIEYGITSSASSAAPDRFRTEAGGGVAFSRRRATWGWLDQPGTPGFVVAGYGTWRGVELPGQSTYFVSGDPERQGSLRTLFQPGLLTSCERWLQQLDYRVKDSSGASRRKHKQHLDAVTAVINGLLPEGGAYRLNHVNAQGVWFTGPEGAALSLSQLSDGFRTLFGLAVDLLRWASDSLQPDQLLFRKDKQRVFVDISGVVLIDEPEAHLHPKWQRQIGFYLQRAFPKVQFIVATHSPFVVQAATGGSVFVLSRESEVGPITVSTPFESVQGWRAEQILSSPAFDLESTRDPETERLMREHSRLQARVDVGQPLNDTDRKRLQQLKNILQETLPAPGNTYQEVMELTKRYGPVEKADG